MSNKFIGMYKTENEYDWRECLILSYGIPLNSEFTEFDFANTLIVDLRSISQSVADYLRDLTLSSEVARFKTFMEFASTRKYQGKDVDVLNHLNTMDVIKKVPSDAVVLKFKDSVRGDYTTTVEEINAMIEASIKEADEVPEEAVPYTERVVREERVHGMYPKTEPVEQVLADSMPSSEIAELKTEIADLREMVTGLASRLEDRLPKKSNRNTKAKTKTTEDKPVETTE